MDKSNTIKSFSEFGHKLNYSAKPSIYISTVNLNYEQKQLILSKLKELKDKINKELNFNKEIIIIDL